MTNSAQEWIRRIHTLSNEGAFQSEIAQIKAKALLKEVSREVPQYSWNYVASRVVRNITAASLGLETLSRTEPFKLNEIQDSARQIARAWESLSRLGERTSWKTALMNAAVAYELAGYQANATCLARQLYKDFSAIQKPSVEAIASAFLQRLFIRVGLLASRTQEEPVTVGIIGDAILGDIALALAGEGLASASKYFLSGNKESISRATQSLEESEQIFASLGAVEESNLTRSLRSLLPFMIERSTWNSLADLAENNPRGRRYLKLLARGIGSNILKSPSVSELWPSQMEALENGLLTSPNKIIKMPTSAGKTRIAELAIVHTLVTEPGSKCVYIAPYRALVWELEQAFLNLFGDLGFRISSIIGTYESDDFEQLLIGDADILVMTPEKLDLLQRIEPKFLNNVRLFVMDEGQIVHDRERGVKFELLLTRLKKRLPNAFILFLSAVVPRETLEDFAQWFEANPSRDILVSTWRPSIQRHAKFEWQGETGVIRYPFDEDVPLIRSFVSGIIKQKIYEFVNQKTGRTNRKRFPDITNKAQTAAEIAFRFAELGCVLVFCSQTNFVESVAKALDMRLTLSRLTEEDIPHYFTIAYPNRSLLSAKEWLGDDHLVTRMITKGIALHHGALPEAVRKSVETDFRDRRFRILIATNTLAQGVNLPIRTAIIHSCWRHTEQEGSERISARDYWNIAGRAGRAGEETEGTIIHIVRSDSDERDYQYYQESRENVEPVQSALFELMKNLVEERLSEESVREKLDPEVLALLVEEGINILSEDSIQKILDGTLVKVQASRHGVDMGRLRSAFLDTASNIAKRVDSPSLRSKYSSTGLSTESCETLRIYIESNQDLVTTMLKQADSRNLETLVTLVLDACLKLSEMQSSRTFGGSYNELLTSWLSGASIHEIMAEFSDQAGSPEELARFIDELFAYRLPWGISAFIRIATGKLGLESKDLSDYAKFLPSMVKFGVPIPIACWALAAGIPFRDTAIKMASRYMQEGRAPNYNEFLEWLSKVDSERLQHEFLLESPVLEDVTRALCRTGINPLLRDHASIEELLPYKTWIRGISFENRRIVASKAREGQSVELIRNYENPVDRNAIKVTLNGETLGFLERQLAQLVAPDLDSGLLLKGTITKIERGYTPEIEIQISGSSCS